MQVLICFSPFFTVPALNTVRSPCTQGTELFRVNYNRTVVRTNYNVFAVNNFVAENCRSLANIYDYTRS